MTRTKHVSGSRGQATRAASFGVVLCCALAVSCIPERRDWSRDDGGAKADAAHGSQDAGADAGANTGADAGDEEDAGLPAPFRTAAEECRVYTDEPIDFSGYARDFPVEHEPSPSEAQSLDPRWQMRDVALVWQAPDDAIYVPEVTSDTRLAKVRVLRGECGGDELYFWRSGTRFSAGLRYTFVIEAPATTKTVRLVITKPCTDEATCIEGTACGLEVDLEYEPVCAPLHQPGEIDARCPDAIVDSAGARVEGCCRPDGRCGHVAPQLGCHTLIPRLENWPYDVDFFCDERAAPNPPDTYFCIASGQPCQQGLDCCSHPSYGNGFCEAGVCETPEG